MLDSGGHQGHCEDRIGSTMLPRPLVWVPFVAALMRLPLLYKIAQTPLTSKLIVVYRSTRKNVDVFFNCICATKDEMLPILDSNSRLWEDYIIKSEVSCTQRAPGKEAF